MKCPKCGSENIIFEDNSFSHEFGVEVIHNYYCDDCEYELDPDDIDEAEKEELMKWRP